MALSCEERQDVENSTLLAPEKTLTGQWFFANSARFGLIADFLVCCFLVLASAVFGSLLSCLNGYSVFLFHNLMGKSSFKL